MNPTFLDPRYAADAVFGPTVAGLGEPSDPESRLGVILVQFTAMDLTKSGPTGGVSGLIARMDRFLAELASRDLGAERVPTAFEFRNPQVYERDATREIAAVLRGHGAAWATAVHPHVPPLAEQVRALDAAGLTPDAQPVEVVRWLLRRDQTYTGAKQRYGPFGAIVDPDPVEGGAVADRAWAAAQLGTPTFIIVNNKAEGSAPRTVGRLARAVAGRKGTTGSD